MTTTLKATILAAMLVGLAGVALATPKPVPSPAAPRTAEVGQKAPAFSLTDIEGTQHALKDHTGKIVVIEWFNAGCPYSGKASPKSVHASGRVAALRNQLRAVDSTVVYLLIDSTARRAEKSDIITADKAARKQWKIDAPILIDFDGAVGHAYKAQTTPHMFVIDSDGVLRYQGAFDNDKRNVQGDAATNHVLAAVKKIKAGENPSPSKTRAWGCSVKYGS
jgi:peroxiredoxin